MALCSGYLVLLGVWEIAEFVRDVADIGALFLRCNVDEVAIFDRPDSMVSHVINSGSFPIGFGSMKNFDFLELRIDLLESLF